MSTLTIADELGLIRELKLETATAALDEPIMPGFEHVALAADTEAAVVLYEYRYGALDAQADA